MHRFYRSNFHHTMPDCLNKLQGSKIDVKQIPLHHKDFIYTLHMNICVDLFKYKSEQVNSLGKDFVITFLIKYSGYYYSGEKYQYKIYEIYKSNKEREEDRCRIKALSEHAKENNIGCEVLVHEDLKTHYLENIKFLAHYFELNLDSTDHYKVRALRDMMHRLRATDINSLLQAICSDQYNRGRLIPMLWFCISKNLIGCDLSVPLTMDSRLWAVELLDKRK